jgi:hypothetical protein
MDDLRVPPWLSKPLCLGPVTVIFFGQMGLFGLHGQKPWNCPDDFAANLQLRPPTSPLPPRVTGWHRTGPGPPQPVFVPDFTWSGRRRLRVVSPWTVVAFRWPIDFGIDVIVGAYPKIPNLKFLEHHLPHYLMFIKSHKLRYIPSPDIALWVVWKLRSRTSK